MTDDQSDFDRGILPQSKRITIPLGDRFILRNFADYLRGLANTMDHYSRLPATPDLSNRLMVLQIVLEIDRVNSMIKETARQAGLEVKEGRPKNSERVNGGETERETGNSFVLKKPQYPVR